MWADWRIRVLPALFLAACMLPQSYFSDALWWQWIGAALGVALSWQIPLLRHGAASLGFGGLGMMLGALIDQHYFGAPSCHAGTFGFATVLMIGACVVSCRAVCRLHGADPGGVVRHSIIILTMLAGEEVARALCSIWGIIPTHALMVLGMAVGSALGVPLAALLLRDQRDDGGALLGDAGDGLAVEFRK